VRTSITRALLLGGIALTPAYSALAAELAILNSGFHIRHEKREEIGEITRLHTETGYIDVQTTQIEGYEIEEVPPPEPKALAVEPLQGSDIDALIEAAGARYSLDPDLIHCLISAESSYNPRAVSPKGARGLMQLMPATAADLGVTDSFDAAANIDAGTRYLSTLLTQYDNDLVKALAAYNAGPERVKQYGGVPPFRETRQYVSRIVKQFNQKKRAQAAAAKKAVRQASPAATLQRAKAQESEHKPTSSTSTLTQ
jgi:soluble lytic murein transglycosylase-like protein